MDMFEIIRMVYLSGFLVSFLIFMIICVEDEGKGKKFVLPFSILWFIFVPIIIIFEFERRMEKKISD